MFQNFRINIDEDGDYKLCFDNRFSSFNTKTVYFELIIETEDGNDIDFDEGIKSKSLDDEQYEITIHFIEVLVSQIWEIFVSRSNFKIRNISAYLLRNLNANTIFLFRNL